MTSPMSKNQKVNQKKCQQFVVEFMSFLDNNDYATDHEFVPSEVLQRVSPDDVANFLKLKAYGTTTPSSKAKLNRLSPNTLLFCKTALSSFFAETRRWDEKQKTGNPTKSEAVNAVIKKITKKWEKEKKKKAAFASATASAPTAVAFGNDRSGTSAATDSADPAAAAMVDSSSRQKDSMSVNAIPRGVSMMGANTFHGGGIAAPAERRMTSVAPRPPANGLFIDAEAILFELDAVKKTVDDLKYTVMQQESRQAQFMKEMGQFINEIAPQSVDIRSVFPPSSGETNKIFLKQKEERSLPPPGNTLGNAKLSKNLKTLHALWMEYQFGLNGDKPAKDFNKMERGSCKVQYCRRKVFWNAVERFILKGFSWEAAIDRILDVYGSHNSVAKILKMMQKDRVAKVDRLGV